ncbi:MarR family winged helix-turn-helix transcriptional regulator [Phycicoccus flavus]|uniref:MarR family transcriptional regulator n=1 Tax=Phycicoccus flavus TaxID=2502783 RepID=A0A8T6R960_9MICO|nr:MarR family transcriptional regulator [Phycicoccus flavus]NHA70063.1 MarR family transcriptional regulator [Phycicoccus flavus]
MRDPGAETVDELLERLSVRATHARMSSRCMFLPQEDRVGDLPLLLRLASTATDRRVSDRLAGLELALTPPELEVLRRVAQKPSGGRDLATYLGRSPQRVSAVLARLVELGLVQREPSWRDSRVHAARPTDAGLDAVDDAAERLAGTVGVDLDGLGVEVRDLFARVLVVVAAG